MNEKPRETGKTTDASQALQSESQKETSHDTKSERRRALLLGLAALPAVITVTSQPLWAASGNLSGGSGANTVGGQTGPVSLQQLQQP